MTFLRELLKVELTALAALAACAAIFAAWGLGEVADVTTTFGLDTIKRATLLFAVVSAFGLLPVIFVGAPIYTLLRRRGYANWATALLVGLLPGIVIFFLDANLGIYALLAGLVVSLATHFRFRNQL